MDMVELGQFFHAFVLFPIIIALLPLSVLLIINKIFQFQSKTSKNVLNTTTTTTKIPKSYPLIGHSYAFYKHKRDRLQWLSTLISSSPSSTFVLHLPFGGRMIMTANPANVEHILKTHFPIYQKGPNQRGLFHDLLGNGIFNTDSEKWKSQRQLSSHEFNTKSLRRFLENVVESELSNRLIPVFSEAAKSQAVLDLQDILQRFGYDNICKFAFGYDPENLSPSLLEDKSAIAFDESVVLVSRRIPILFPILWKIKRFLNIGSEKRLRKAIGEVREFAKSIVGHKKQGIAMNSVLSEKTEDLLSRFLKSCNSDETFAIDMIINVLIAGRDSTSSALTWFFWLLHKNPRVEEEILKEIKNRGKQSNKTEDSSVLEQLKNMNYTHAALCESMRLYPPIPVIIKEAAANDILPDGTLVKKGMQVSFPPYAMGRVERIWGSNWAEFRPERWLELENVGNEGDVKWKFVSKDPYLYPIFQAGPRVCPGKDMAFLQMKRVIVCIVEKFRVVPLSREGLDPDYLVHISGKMKDGLSVKIKERRGKE